MSRRLRRPARKTAAFRAFPGDGWVRRAWIVRWRPRYATDASTGRARLSPPGTLFRDRPAIPLGFLRLGDPRRLFLGRGDALQALPQRVHEVDDLRRRL